MIPIEKKELSRNEKISFIQGRFEEIMEVLGLDLNDPSLAKTPERVAKMYVDELFSGLDPDTFPDLTFMEGIADPNSMVMTKAQVNSTCEHHLVPMTGMAWVAYLPKKKIIGLSKIPRIVRFFSKKPQVQERLNVEIAQCLQELLETEDVAVATALEHMCVKARGVQDVESLTRVHTFRGAFKSDPMRQREFLAAIS